MADELSEVDWCELTALVVESPPERIRAAVGRVGAWARPRGPAPRLLTCVDRLLHLGAISSGWAFDRALLEELRHLSLH